MGEKLRQLGTRIDALSVRERGFIMLTVLVAIYVLWDSALMRPLNAQEAMFTRSIVDTRMEIDKLNASALEITRLQTVDPDAENRARRDKLEADLKLVNAELDEVAEHLIAPEDMAEVLETVLKRSADVHFLKLEGLGSASILPGTGDNAATGTPASGARDALLGAFKHGLRLEFQGGYLETLKVLRELETLPWAFFWESVDLEVKGYPNARTAVTVFTLSWKKDWIGV